MAKDYMFTNVKDRPVCLVSGAIMAVTKENAQFAQNLSVLSAEFPRRFADFEAQKCRFDLLSNFAVDVESAPTNLQIELI
ncbi:hypothetical protein QQF64_031605 [Cirrhinus molitorella]|uniref:Uncharacterized protein n=1 Tax=Cirrhinus molitorella TaxID=172907 RepID=A0ABR3MXK0_9TELE